MKQMIMRCLPLFFFLILTSFIHFGDIEPFQRGFFCDDETLKYPYIENQTIPAYVCITGWVSISLFTILFTQKVSKSFSIKVILDMITGVMCCLLLTDITKYSAGRLRPHFLTLCNPDFNNICFDKDAYYTDYNGEEHLNEFYQKYVLNRTNEIDGTNVCSIEKLELLREARLSFISGHASISFYFATFLIVYMNRITKHLKCGNKIVPFIQIFMFMLATWISFTRISDYYHYPLDVFGGAIAGVGVALYYIKNIKPTNNSSEDLQLQ